MIWAGRLGATSPVRLVAGGPAPGSSREIADVTPKKGAALVRFVGVQKSYDGETLVVKNLDLDIWKGEFLTVLGPSGSGKTTCLMMLAGFETATHGDILLDGASINNLPPYRRDIGMVFQNYALFPHMTVAENVAFPLRVRRLGGAEVKRRVKRALDMVRLGGFGDRRPGQLSGGQQQRVAVARALVFEPKFVLMDEPLGALDKQLREQMQYEIKQLHAELGLTVVYVTHDQAEALTMSDRIAVFHEGAIQQLSTPIDLYERPETAFVAHFIGENNRLPGELVAVTAAECTVRLPDGSAVQALPVNVGAVGSPVTLSLRPERVLIDPPDGACRNRFEAQIQELHYLGDHLRIRATVVGRDDFIIKVPNAVGQAWLHPRQTVTIGWRAEDCRALEAEPRPDASRDANTESETGRMNRPSSRNNRQ